MGGQRLHEFWDLVRGQHGVVSRQQLIGLGFTASAIRHRLAAGRLHTVWRGVYAVGRPELSRHGRWMAAVLACGRGAALSDRSAAALWGIGEYERGVIEVSVPGTRALKMRHGIRVHRRKHLGGALVSTHDGIPVTSVARTLIDLARTLTTRQLERAINEAANLDLLTPSGLRLALDERAGERGVRRLRSILDPQTFRLTRSDLERLFLPLAAQAGLGAPQTGTLLNGFEVDFFFEDLGLVVETDGLRYHRTPAQQARDRLRDQAHLAAGLTPIRFTHAQVKYEPGYVVRTLASVATHLRNS